MNNIMQPLPFQAIANEAARSFRAKRCLHPEASSQTCGKIIGAHTIQRAGALRRVVDKSNHVLTFYPLKHNNNGEPEIHRRGWKEASVFSGFCDKHDSSTFSALESCPFTGSAEQCFLIAYRAHCHELYQKLAAREANPAVRELGCRGRTREEQDHLRHIYQVMADGTEKALVTLHHLKQTMDNDLLNQRYDRWHRLIVEFDGEISVVGTAGITPNLDFSGNSIQVLHDFDARTQYLYFCIAPIQPGGSMVFTWLRDDSAITHFIDSLQTLSRGELPHILVQMMFAYCENTYFSETWWTSLNPDVQRHIASLAANTNPGYSRLVFLQNSVSPWSIRKIART